MTDLLLPEIDDESQPFWDGTAAGELRIQECGGCGRLRHPPRPMCPWCRSLERGWRSVSGRGTVWSFVVPHPPLLPAYAAMAPYNVIVVALDDDPTIRLVGNLLPLDDTDVEIGEPVEVVFDEPIDGIVLPRWERAVSGTGTAPTEQPT